MPFTSALRPTLTPPGSILPPLSDTCLRPAPYSPTPPASALCPTLQLVDLLHPAHHLPRPSYSAVHVPAVGAAEVVWVVGVVLEHKGLLVNDQVAPLTDILAQALGLLAVVAGPAQVPVGRRGAKDQRPTPPFLPRKVVGLQGKETSGAHLPLY